MFIVVVELWIGFGDDVVIYVYVDEVFFVRNVLFVKDVKFCLFKRWGDFVFGNFDMSVVIDYFWFVFKSFDMLYVEVYGWVEFEGVIICCCFWGVKYDIDFFV